MSPQVASEHIYEMDAEGNPTRLLVAKGDYVPATATLSKDQEKMLVDEDVFLTAEQANLLNSGSPHLTQEQAEAVVKENEATYAIGRAQDAASSPHATNYPGVGDAVGQGGYAEKADYEKLDPEAAVEAAKEAKGEFPAEENDPAKQPKDQAPESNKAQPGPKEPAKASASKAKK